MHGSELAEATNGYLVIPMENVLGYRNVEVTSATASAVADELVAALAKADEEFEGSRIRSAADLEKAYGARRT